MQCTLPWPLRMVTAQVTWLNPLINLGLEVEITLQELPELLL